MLAEIAGHEADAQTPVGRARRNAERSRPVGIGARHRSRDERAVAALQIGVVARLVGQKERLLQTHGGGDGFGGSGRVEVEGCDHAVEGARIGRARGVDLGGRLVEDRQLGKAHAHARADIAGRQRQSGRIGGLGLAALVAVEQQRPQIGMGKSKPGIESYRAAKCGFGRVEIGLLVQRCPQIVPQIGRIRRCGESRAVAFDRRIEGAAAMARARQQRMRARRIRHCRAGPLETRFGCSMVRQSFEAHALLDPRVAEIRRQARRPAVGRRCGSPIALFGKRVAEIRMRLGIGRVETHGIAQICRGRRVAFERQFDRAERHVDERQPNAAVNQCAVGFCGRPQFARLMMGNRAPKDRRKIAHLRIVSRIVFKAHLNTAFSSDLGAETKVVFA